MLVARASVLLVIGGFAPFVHAQGKALEAGADWGTSAHAQLERAEYHYQAVKGERGVWSAPNRAQSLRSRVSANGLELFSRSTGADGQGAPWKLQLRTTSFGRADGAFALTSSGVSVSEVRVELDHGLLVEWFENRPEGLQQGWTIPGAPSGAEPLWIGLELTGGLALCIADGARDGVFVDGTGAARLRYGGLKAWDASGRELAAALRPAPQGFGVEVDTLGAVYPLTVDPLFTFPAWAAVGGQAAANFGIAVSSAGDVNGDGYSDVIVGASFYDNGETDEGRAFVYHGSAGGLSLSANWSAESDQAGAEFGDAVSTAGDVNGDGYSDVIIGAPLFDGAEGRAYVYLGSATGLAASAAWALGSGQAGSEFGRPVATAGDVNGDGYSDVIVGAYAYDSGETDEGRAYVYHGSALGLGVVPAWITEPDQIGALYGNTCSTAGDVNGDGYDDVIVCSLYFDNGQTDEGRAFVYHGSASGLPTTADWTYETDQAFAYLQIGASAGDVNGDGFGDVVVAATDYDNGEANEGIAVVFLGSSGGLAASGTALESNQAGASFGARAASAGDVDGDGYGDLIVGAPLFDNGQTDEGQVRLFPGTSGGISTTPSFVFDPDQTNARLGRAVAGAGDVNGDGYSEVIVGAHRYTGSQTEEGAAVVFHGGPGTLSTTAAWTAEGDQLGAGLGASVATAGDVNGDGYGDVIVGAPFYDDGQSDEGAAFVYAGSAAGPALSPSWTLEVNQADARFGGSVSGAGDVNGDGYADVIVGARLYDHIQTDEGWAFVYHGSATGLATLPDWSAESNQDTARFGTAVSGAGDVNGDGYADVIIAADYYDNGQTNEGRAFVYQGSATGLSSSPAWFVEPDQANAGLFAVSDAGDVNSDGFGDVILGIVGYDNGEIDEGRALVYHGSAGGLLSTPSWTAEGNALDVQFGHSVSSAGDVNGDGYGDVIVGIPRYDVVNRYGAVSVYLGSPTGVTATPVWTSVGDQAGDSLYGVVVACAGDVNGDGYDEVIFTANSYDAPEVNEGRAYLHLGSASGPAASPALTLEGDQASAFLHAVSGAGDVNGDGYGDVIVGAYGFDAPQLDEGLVVVLLGNEGRGGLVRELQQRTRNGARPIAVVGSTGESGLFRIRCEFPRNAAGVSWASPETPEAWLEWEVTPLGVPFDGAWIQRGAAQSLVPAGGALTFDELATLEDAAGHARAAKAQSYAWRARVATNSPLFPHTAWFSVQGSSPTEAKLRKPRRVPQ